MPAQFSACQSTCIKLAGNPRCTMLGQVLQSIHSSAHQGAAARRSPRRQLDTTRPKFIKHPIMRCLRKAPELPALFVYAAAPASAAASRTMQRYGMDICLPGFSPCRLCGCHRRRWWPDPRACHVRSLSADRTRHPVWHEQERSRLGNRHVGLAVQPPHLHHLGHHHSGHCRRRRGCLSRGLGRHPD